MNKTDRLKRAKTRGNKHAPFLSLHFPWEAMKVLACQKQGSCIISKFVHMLRVVSQRCQVLSIEQFWGVNCVTNGKQKNTQCVHRYRNQSAVENSEHKHWVAEFKMVELKFRECRSIVSKMSSRYAWKVCLLKIWDLISMSFVLCVLHSNLSFFDDMVGELPAENFNIRFVRQQDVLFYLAWTRTKQYHWNYSCPLSFYALQLLPPAYFWSAGTWSQRNSNFKWTDVA